MARIFRSSLHPRDKNGKFRSKGGGGSSSKKGAQRRSLVVGPRSYLGAYATAKGNRTGKPVANRGKASRASEQAVAGILTGIHATQGGKVAVGSATAAAGFAASGNHVTATAFAAKALTSGAGAANEIHRINTITSDKFKGKTVQEQSKFHKNSARREKLINGADNAADMALSLSIGLGLATPHVKILADMKNKRRAYSDSRGLPRQGAKVKAAKANRHGVYNISDVKGRRVA